MRLEKKWQEYSEIYNTYIKFWRIGDGLQI